jgi:ABC-type amino acid transport substrate-binding protein
MRSKWLVILAAACMYTTTVAATLTFVTNADSPPFVEKSTTGNLQGFDIDLANALCDQLHVQCIFKQLPNDEFIPAIQQGTAHAAIAALTATPEKQQYLAFTDSYYRATASLISHKNNRVLLHHENTFTNKTIGVRANSVFATFLHLRYQGKVNIKTYTDVRHALYDLQNYKIDAVLAHTPIINSWLNHASHALLQDLTEESEHDMPELNMGFAIAVHKENHKLRIALNEALAAIRQNGIYDLIAKRYLFN